MLVPPGEQKRDAERTQTAILRVPLLDVAHAHDELLDRNRLLVAKRVALRLEARRIDENVGVGRDAGDGDAAYA
jgi:hypothetical protein